MAVAVAVAVLVLGRLPDRREADLVLPALLGGAARRRWSSYRSSGGRSRPPAGSTRGPRPLDEVLRTLGDRASRGVALEELLLQLAEQLRASLQLRHVEVWTGDGTSLDRLLSVPHRPSTSPACRGRRWRRCPGPAWRARVAADLAAELLPELLPTPGTEVRAVTARHAGSVLGLLVVERGPGADRFGESDESLLDEVGRRLGLLLHNRTLDAALTSVLDDLRRANDDLRASRARVVAAADRERRRIERDLHDGAQQHLVALAINLGLAADLCRDDPTGAVELLESSRQDVRATVQQLRDLAHGIYPTLLSDAGLGPALQAAAVRCPRRSSSMSPTSRPPPVRPVDRRGAVLLRPGGAAERRQARPRRPVRVTGRREERRLVLEVADEGPGLPPGALDGAGGQGLQNLRDRMGAVGGTVDWDVAPRPRHGGHPVRALRHPAVRGG
jgi:signal transduction histidine kinase